MNKKLQSVAKQLALLIAHSKPKKRVSYHLQIGVGACEEIRFSTHLWDGREKGESDILKSHYVSFNGFDKDLTIARKMVEITNIINGEINPFEEEKHVRN